MEQLQRVPEWYIDKLGKFSGSEFWKLHTGGRRDMTPAELEEEKKKGGKRKTIDTMFGDVAYTYIDDKIAEIITNGTCIDYKYFDTKETRWGNTWEPEAKIKFTEATGIQIEECGFINISKRFGCSPDGKTSDGGILEVKCPYNTNVHLKNLRLTSGAELLDLNKNYYIQMQIEMLAIGAKFGYYVSYDPRCSPLLQLKILRVERDEEMIKEIELRKDEAVKILESEIDKLFILATTTKTLAA